MVTSECVEKDDKTLQSSQAQVVAETVAAIVVSKTLTEAAQILRISRSALYDRIHKYNLKTVLDPFIEQAFYSLKMGSIKAAEELVHQLDNSNVHIRTEAAKEILDRVGVRAGATNMITQVNNHIKQPEDLTELELDEVLNRAKIVTYEKPVISLNNY